MHYDENNVFKKIDTTLEYHVAHSNPHMLFEKMVELGFASSNSDAFEKCWNSLMKTETGTNYLYELNDFLYHCCQHFAPQIKKNGNSKSIKYRYTEHDSSGTLGEPEGGCSCDSPNLDHLIKLQKGKEFYDVYQKSEWVVCDSKILYLFGKLLKTPIKEAILGSSFFTSYYMYHKNDADCKIFLLGAKEGIAAKAMERINEKVGRQMVVGAHSPSFGFEKHEDECEKLVRIVNESGANVLLVGVGAPKQEKWIMKYRDKMPGVKVFMALGATIDFEAGTLKRAPKIWQKIGMEWLYRCMKEPKRLFKRYFVDDMQFFYYFGKQFLGIYKDPFRKK